MHVIASCHKQWSQSVVSRTAVEVLESRQLLSASIVTPADTTDSPVAASTINATVGKKFKDAVGTWTTTEAVPAGTTATATVDWGDGKTSRAKLVDDGSGVIQILGSHAWKTAGTFQTFVKVQERVKGHPPQITDVGQSGGSAVVAPKPTPISLKGTLTGDYTTPLGNPDARSYNFTGTGSAGDMGTVDLTGTITPPGFIKSAPATGELTLTAPGGTITLELTGKPQNGGTPVPQKMKYVAGSGTGTFANSGGKGSIAIALDDTASTFVMVLK
jgi:hypothetical protein